MRMSLKKREYAKDIEDKDYKDPTTITATILVAN